MREKVKEEKLTWVKEFDNFFRSLERVKVKNVSQNMRDIFHNPLKKARADCQEEKRRM